MDQGTTLRHFAKTVVNLSSGLLLARLPIPRSRNVECVELLLSLGTVPEDEPPLCIAVPRPVSPPRHYEGMINSGGLSNQYTDNLYSYAPQSTCSSSNPNGCNSAYLFCNTQVNACVGRIKPGSSCSLVNGVDPCYGVCQGGMCVAPSADAPRRILLPTLPPSASVVPVPDELCFNMNQCCGPWSARGECYRNPGVMRVVCPASCGWCTPRYNLGDNCVNRASTCQRFKLTGECTQNYQWMAENCRKECAYCQKTREQMCPELGPGVASDSPRTPTIVQQCTDSRPCCIDKLQRTCSTLPSLIKECGSAHLQSPQTPPSAPVQSDAQAYSPYSSK
ncbi:hypothetical protein RB195_002383 [Necator americanus]